MPKCIICHVYKFWSNETSGISLGALSSSLFSCLPTCPHHTSLSVHTSHFKCQEYCDGSWMSQ